jgi:GNAT superfamily N-acetyltransferase
MIQVMATVVQRKRVLAERPAAIELPDVRLRTFAGESDIQQWLDVRERSFARQKLGVRSWDEADFGREFLDKPWWRPEWMWFAEVANAIDASGSDPGCIGTTAMALRESATNTTPVVHWLCVVPSWRRRGVGRLLISALEGAAWDAGFREIALETHEAWREAAALYDALGYQVTRPSQAF